MPALYMEKLKSRPILIGHERCAASQFGAEGQVVICAYHMYNKAAAVLHNGKTYFGCPKCIEESCPIVEARTEDKARGLWENLET